MDNNNENKITAPSISLPKGGGAIKGIGEMFQPNPFTGTGNLSIPIYTSSCRDFEPKLSLDYSSGSGNDIFGIGFSLSIPNISRKTEKGLPKYEDLDSDTFVLSNAEDLVPQLVEKDGEWIKDEKQINLDNIPYQIIKYRPRTEGLFAKIELWKNLENCDIHWEVTSKENIKSVYGKKAAAKIVNPENPPDKPAKAFKWLIEETSDAKGNRILYEYKREDKKNILNVLNEKDRIHTANKYIKRIKYGNYFDENDNEKWAFEGVFDYGEHDINNNPYTETKDWFKRKDSFSSYRSGFEIRTQRLCRRVLMFHHFDELGNVPCLVRSTDLEYNETPIMTFLKAVKQKGYKKDNNGDCVIAEIPPLEFTYSTYGPTKQIFKPLSVESGGTIPGLINQSEYMMVDLYGEGISGILYSDGSTILYWSGEGKGAFAGPKTVQQFPIEKAIKQPQLTLMDLGGDGKLDLVVNEPSRTGYYQSNPDGSWEPFKNFESYPKIDFQNPNKETVDLNGDGFADILLVEDDQLSYYPSKGKKGYDDAIKLIKENHGDTIPGNNYGSSIETLRFSDIFGDGLSHRVRIRNGIVESWPNLGYGRFGKKVLFDNAPHFGDKMDPSRLFLADIDGSGTTDLIYAHEDKIDVYFNQSGNSFSDPISIPLPQGFDNHDQIQIADVLGNGTSCMVLTKNKPGYKGIRHDYYDFTGGVKPHLLVELTNNIGSTTRIKYASSTKFYLEDEKAGKPWISRLPFPVYLIEKTETIDHISGSKLVTTYKYHHGFYVGEDREFRGFGCVEQWDTESFEQFSHTDLIDEIPFEVTEEGLHVPPVHTKTWYHTGAYEREGILSRQYEKEYYPKDSHGDLDALLLPDSVFDTEYREIDTASIREADRALKGQVLRQEIYAEDNKPGVSEHPYIVTEANFIVRLLQPKKGQTHAVYYVHPHESITYHYERIKNDPRIEHQFTLEVDDFGNVLQSCNVFYPRRDVIGRHVYPEQDQIKAIVKRNKFIDEIQNFYLLGIPYENKSFEIGGLDLKGEDYFSFNEIKSQVKTALEMENVILFDQKLSQSQLQARLFSWQRHYYWNENQNNHRSLGRLTERALLNRTEEAVFSKNQVQTVYNGNVDNIILTNEGGYKEAEAGDEEYEQARKHWWNPGLTQHYYKENKFYLPFETEDTFGAETKVEYDKYCLSPCKITDAVLNISEATKIDYTVLQPKEIKDANDNISQVLFDPLGMIKVTSIHGFEGDELKGGASLLQYQERDEEILRRTNDIDIRIILDKPEFYLQGAMSYFYYDLFAWKDRQEPVHYLNLLRETHVSELQDDEKSRIQYHIAFSDGFGREHQKKIKAEPGKAFKRDENNKILFDDEGNVLVADCDDRWLVSGRTVYNNKSKPVKQYEPFYSCTLAYEKEKEVTDAGVTPIIHYDPLLRVIRTDMPKGFFSKAEFSPWMEKSWDENDTVKDSKCWQEFTEILDCTVDEEETNNEKDALNKACKHYNTPQETVLDNLGNKFLIIQKNDNGQRLITKYEVDIQGNELAITDPRQYILNQTRIPQEIIKNFIHIFNMVGTKLSIDSVDAGLGLNLNNTQGQNIHTWNSREYHLKTTYDKLQRPIEIRVAGNELNQIVEKMIYGEGQGDNAGDDKKKNLRGQLFLHYDQAGIQYFDLYDIKEQVRITRRKLRADYKSEVNWNDINAVDLEDNSYLTETIYDALGRISSQKNPDESFYEPEYHPSGTLNKILVTLKDASQATKFIEEIEYNAKGQREKIKYGNGIITKYAYESETFRLKYLKTYRERDGKIFQDIYYTYDPVGNITRIIDNSHKTVFCDQSEVKPLSDYTYDALYQLKRATGREHPALSSDNYKRNGFKQSQYLPLCQDVHPNDVQKLQIYTRSYTYDESGNMTQIKHIASQSQRSRTRNLIASETSNRTVTEEMLQSQSPEDFFDENGNMIELEHLRDIRWNFRDNIESVDIIQREDGPSDSEYYVYDSAGMRIRKVWERYTHGGTVIEIEEKIYLGNCEIKRIKKKSNNNIDTIFERKTLHVIDDERRIALVHNWIQDDMNRETDNIGERKIHYQLGNHLGSCSLELNESTDIISYEEYFPYGGTAFIAGQSQNAEMSKEVKRKEYRYSDKERDDSTGFYYYETRYYAPWKCSWISPDQAGIVDGVNLYLFVKNRPIVMFDEMGLQGQKIHHNEHELPLSNLENDASNSVIEAQSEIIPDQDTLAEQLQNQEEFREALKEFRYKYGDPTAVEEFEKLWGMLSKGKTNIDRLQRSKQSTKSSAILNLVLELGKFGIEILKTMERHEKSQDFMNLIEKAEEVGYVPSLEFRVSETFQGEKETVYFVFIKEEERLKYAEAALSHYENKLNDLQERIAGVTIWDRKVAASTKGLKQRDWILEYRTKTEMKNHIKHIIEEFKCQCSLPRPQKR